MRVSPQIDKTPLNAESQNMLNDALHPKEKSGPSILFGRETTSQSLQYQKYSIPGHKS